MTDISIPMDYESEQFDPISQRFDNEGVEMMIYSGVSLIGCLSFLLWIYTSMNNVYFV